MPGGHVRDLGLADDDSRAPRCGRGRRRDRPRPATRAPRAGRARALVRRRARRDPRPLPVARRGIGRGRRAIPPRADTEARLLRRPLVARRRRVRGRRAASGLRLPALARLRRGRREGERHGSGARRPAPALAPRAARRGRRLRGRLGALPQDVGGGRRCGRSSGARVPGAGAWGLVSVSRPALDRRRPAPRSGRARARVRDDPAAVAGPHSLGGRCRARARRRPPDVCDLPLDPVRRFPPRPRPVDEGGPPRGPRGARGALRPCGAVHALARPRPEQDGVGVAERRGGAARARPVRGAAERPLGHELQPCGRGVHSARRSRDGRAPPPSALRAGREAALGGVRRRGLARRARGHARPVPLHHAVGRGLPLAVETRGRLPPVRVRLHGRARRPGRPHRPAPAAARPARWRDLPARLPRGLQLRPRPAGTALGGVARRRGNGRRSRSSVSSGDGLPSRRLPVSRPRSSWLRS